MARTGKQSVNKALADPPTPQSFLDATPQRISARRSSSRLSSRQTRSSLRDHDPSDMSPVPSSEAPERRLLKEVAIRQISASKPTTRLASKASMTSLSSQNDSSKSSRVGSLECETPLTSLSTTPSAAILQNQPTNTHSSLKRSRATRATNRPLLREPIGDSKLALALQKMEYLKELRTSKRKAASGLDEEDVEMEDVDDEYLFPDEDEHDDDYDEEEMDEAEESFHEEDDTSVDYAHSRRPIPSSSKRPPKKKLKVIVPRRSRPSRGAASRKMPSAEEDGDPGLLYLEDFLNEDHITESHGPWVKLQYEDIKRLRDDVAKAVADGKSEEAEKLNSRLSIAEAKWRLYVLSTMNVWQRKKMQNRWKLEKNHPHLKHMWQTLATVPIIEPVEVPQPEAISRKLKPFQLKGVDWMIKQEKTHYKGGLLGDEMGMGKTIQAVSLIMSDYPVNIPTLVVVPPVALMQWESEIKDYTDGRLKVLVYHGTNSKTKNMSSKDLKKFDVIIVSYNSLESLHRKETKGWSRGDTLVRESSPLHSINFHRLILDEAHSIKSRTTGVAKACFALQGKFKWCLSGTPVQNRIGEFFSLLRFLEVRPFADYFCRSCDCERLHWELNDDHMCPYCKHSGAEHVSVFNQELLNPITGSDTRLREEALQKLHLITARIMLRRMKKDHTSSMELPPKEVVIRREFFGEIERDFSRSIMTNSTRRFDTYVAQGVMLNNYANIFGLIMQMRQVANHPDLLLKKHAEGGQNVLVCNICDEPAEEAIRSRCHHEFCRACVKSYIQTAEGSGNAPDCPRCHIALSIDLEQPDIEQDEELVRKTSIINRIKMENWTSSTKIEMLVYELYKLRSKKQTLKSIVFSQFTSMLQLIEWRLRRAGFNTVMLDGSMTPAQRQKSIEFFMNNADVEVFLVSLKAGGVALNLTEASRVFIVDPWWNPAAEWQSADRCHRIGQRRPCVITRLCIEDSVESRMVLLQEKKAAMISGTINNDKVAMEKLTPEDLQFLFRGT